MLVNPGDVGLALDGHCFSARASFFSISTNFLACRGRLGKR
jgi:hypothetical protein